MWVLKNSFRSMCRPDHAINVPKAVLSFGRGSPTQLSKQQKSQKITHHTCKLRTFGLCQTDVTQRVCLVQCYYLPKWWDRGMERGADFVLQSCGAVWGQRRRIVIVRCSCPGILQALACKALGFSPTRWAPPQPVRNYSPTTCIG